MHRLLLVVALVSLLPSCAAALHTPKINRSYATIHAAIGPDGEPEVGIVGVKRWFRVPWEIQNGEDDPVTLYLRPGSYTIELHCYDGPAYIHYAPTFKVSVAADSHYELGCRPEGYEENFYLDLLRSNYVSKPTAGDGLQLFRLLPAGSGLTRR
jgi:hypothetical protein